MKKSFPHPLIIMLIFVVLSGIFTYFIQSGEYERQFDEKTGRDVVVPGSFHTIEDQNTSISEIVLSIPEGLIEGADILVLILLIGGAFYVIEKTGALQVGIESLIYTFRKSHFLLLFLIGLLFSICGATIAMQEELIAMAPILILLSKKLHYDQRSIVALTLGCALVGGSFSPINPFGGLLSSNIAEVDFNYGLTFRIITLLVVILVWIIFHIKTGRNKHDQIDIPDFKPVTISSRHKVILIVMTFGIFVMGLGIAKYDWDYNQMSGLFFVVGIACGLIGKLGVNGTAKTYTEGFSEMIFAGVIVGLARSIYFVLNQSSSIDPLIQSLFEPLQSLPTYAAAFGMFISQAIIHLPVPSTSGQAVLTTPITAPLTDLLGISRLVAVMSYQFPAGLMDLITPTNGGMMAVIAAVGVNYRDWFAYIWKSFLLLMVLGMISIILVTVYFS
ncbi:YfcC family protein [Algoriphagus sp. SE2]|uniref:YfcC family protein n=1 Tax=Algoriphagus sp. SE2 TaxID=3141536 RepID=UPI0031CDA16B